MSCLLHLLVLLSLLLGPASVAWGQQDDLRRQRTVESRLLHRHLDLASGKLERLDRAGGGWLPYLTPPARLLVVHLWGIFCEPCKREFPLFAKIVRGWRAQPDVKFLFIADPPDYTTKEQVERFWRPPNLPDVDPLRSSNNRIHDALDTDLVPLTLLLDGRGAIRQVFAGPLEERNVDLATSIERLLKILQEEGRR